MSEAISDERMFNYRIEFLNKWRISSLNVDFARLFKTTFQELLYLLIFGFLTALVDFWSLQTRAGPYAPYIVPLCFLSVIVLGKCCEARIVKYLCSFLRLKYTGSTAHFRVFQKIAILAFLIWVNSIASLVDSFAIHSPRNLLKGYGALWTHLSSKLIGSCVVISFFRLYIDLIIYSWKLFRASFNNKDQTIVNHSKQLEQDRTIDDYQNENVNRSEEDDNQNQRTTTVSATRVGDDGNLQRYHQDRF